MNKKNIAVVLILLLVLMEIAQVESGCGHWRRIRYRKCVKKCFRRFRGKRSEEESGSASVAFASLPHPEQGWTFNTRGTTPWKVIIKKFDQYFSCEFVFFPSTFHTNSTCEAFSKCFKCVCYEHLLFLALETQYRSLISPCRITWRHP